MISNTSRLLLVVTLALSVHTTGLRAARATAAQPPSSVIGSWRGVSICVGDHPACKNEDVVYRFEPITEEPGSVMLFADKVIDGKREPMGKLKFQYDEGKGTVSGEFTRRQTHGLWEFRVDGDTMEGTLVLLPDKSIGRRVKVRRVSEDKLPPAPPREEYG